MTRRLPLCLLLFVIVPLLCAAESGTVERIGGFKHPAGAKLRDVIEAGGYRVELGDIAAEIWFRTAIPARAGQNVQGAAYPQLTPSAFVAVITLLKPTTDFRGQSVKAGTYILRYDLLPNDGNHLGVAQNRDFLLLTPIADDPDPTAGLKYDELVNRSRKAAGTNHPAVFNLLPPKAGAVPAVFTEEGLTVFTTRIKTDSGEMPIAIVLKGSTAE